MTSIPSYRLSTLVDVLHAIAHARADDGRRAYACGMRDAARRLDDIIGLADAIPRVHTERVILAAESVAALCIELERAGYSQDEIKLALDGARQARMR